MEKLIKNKLQTIQLEGTEYNALDLLESLNLSEKSISLIFKTPKGIEQINTNWAKDIENALKPVTNLTILVSFHLQKNLKPKIKGVKHIVAIASGKGGVGKSSLCFNLALTAQKTGLKVGILDADIYGPSLPTLSGFNKKPEISNDKKIIPHKIFDVKAMSVGFLVPEDAAVIWRGLMVQNATSQLLNDIAWDYDQEEVDMLFIDLPPGTGDVQLTLLQKINIDGAVIISTPHALALADVKRAFKMFEKMQTTVFGCIENMSGFTCSNCKHHEDFFTNDIVQKFCFDHSVKYLGKLPLDKDFSVACEKGEPFVLNHSDSGISKEFDRIFKNICHNLETFKI